ncbi:aldose epimerase family protein [Christensenella intestinihominis]|uniref:aldose epimerase family protein n=1 Tax=Christensenella intestinihominis TaxID=1851429 RepID=UPI00082CCFF6|nr:hypothetical protein [Christensenella intestinihominis]
MKKLIIKDKKSGLLGEILPDYGGMLTRLQYRGKEIIFFEEGMLHQSNILAGGCPVLFPFPSRTAGDSYKSGGKIYSMPFHGLVKSAPFGVQDRTENSATLYITNNETSMKENFPFDFRLELTYKVEGNAAYFITTVRNRSSEAMPHYFGWHHYFNASDKSQLIMEVNMKRYVNYMDGTEHLNNGKLDLTQPGDYVFDGKTQGSVELINYADGYKAILETDDSYEALVVCTLFDGRITAEPWLGVPDSINKRKYVKWIPPHEYRQYCLAVKIYDIEK